MAYGGNRVATVASDEPVEHLPDLKERQAGLLMAGEPQRSAFAKRDFASGSGFAPLPFSRKKALLLDADNVSERGFPFFEISPDSFAARR
jgi:hypothetical protein